MNPDIYLSVVVYTVLQGLKKASESHDSMDVRIFAHELLERVEYEVKNWNGEFK